MNRSLIVVACGLVVLGSAASVAQEHQPLTPKPVEIIRGKRRAKQAPAKEEACAVPPQAQPGAAVAKTDAALEVKQQSLEAREAELRAREQAVAEREAAAKRADEEARKRREAERRQLEELSRRLNGQLGAAADALAGD